MKNRIMGVAFFIFAAVFIVSGAMLVYNLATAKKESSAFKDLEKIAGSSRVVFTSSAVNESDEPAESLPVETARAEQYTELYEMNEDFFGWLTVEGTDINYPVMHTPDNPEKYLHTAFDGSSSKSGVPFIDGDYREGDGIMTVYGHNMKNGSIFASLLRYNDPSFCALHPEIILGTRYENREYRIFAAFYTEIYPKSRTGVFRYYDLDGTDTEEGFEKYISSCARLSIYGGEELPEFGDEVILLSTCAYNSENGRFVVLGKRV